jgi:hypothetical protein
MKDKTLYSGDSEPPTPFLKGYDDKVKRRETVSPGMKEMNDIKKLMVLQRQQTIVNAEKIQKV